ncbi:hypothetical protein [Deinococcus arcticus]|uniref:Uncharacterized protein n=1 Tax=Deinococcus arcticus TaxID=2136176 RepID=A0A2T3W902_9DEIO|nr:hypothetical protein [Deinococcus arcticus]PTA68381.1 hypothetical protein C8263_08080 [Deinococcus arcticus]
MSRRLRLPALPLKTARTVLDLSLGLLGLGLALTGVLSVAGMLWLLVAPQAGARFEAPLSLKIKIGDVVYRTTGASVPLPHGQEVLVVAGMAALALASAWLIYRRGFALLRRLLFDPFALANSQDLALASRVALLWQLALWAWSVLGWGQFMGTGQFRALDNALTGIPGAELLGTGARLVIGGGVWPSLSFTWLLVAAALAVLSVVFRRAHDLREAERQLRAEQALTV